MGGNAGEAVTGVLRTGAGREAYGSASISSEGSKQSKPTRTTNQSSGVGTARYWGKLFQNVTRILSSLRRERAQKPMLLMPRTTETGRSPCTQVQGRGDHKEHSYHHLLPTYCYQRFVNSSACANESLPVRDLNFQSVPPTWKSLAPSGSEDACHDASKSCIAAARAD